MALARPLCGSPVPTYTFFQPAVLIVLATRTGFQPGVTVPLNDELRRAIIREAGIDPDGLPPDWVRNRKSKAPPGIDRNINVAYRFLHWKTKSGRHGKARTLAGVPGQWGLTELGVVEARALVPEVPAPTPALITPEVPAPTPVRTPKRVERNLTAKWLDKHLTPPPGQTESRLYRHIRSTLAKTCRISASMDLLDDHVNQFIIRLIRRDSLRKKLEAGDRIRYSSIASYAVNSAYTDIRDFGTDAVTREMFGARTGKERRELSEWCDKRSQGEVGPTIRSQKDSDIQWNESGDLHWKDSGTKDLIADRLHFEKVWTRLEDALKTAKPGAWERYSGILKMQIVEDLPVKEIARREQVSPHRAATMLQEARKVIRAVGRDNLID